MKLTGLLILLLAMAGHAGFRSVALLEENDGLGFRGFGKPVSDHGYTQGARLESVWRTLDGRGYETGIGQEVYSPDNITTNELGRLWGEQPYAGWLYFFLGGGRELGPWFLNAELQAGVLGPAAQGGALQRTWHRMIRAFNGRESPPTPGGLGIYEIADAPGFNAHVTAERPVLGSITPGRLRLYWRNGLEGGNVRCRMFSAVRGDFQVIKSGHDSEFSPRITLTADLQMRAAFWNALILGRLMNEVDNPLRLRRLSPEFGVFVNAVVGRFCILAGQRLYLQDAENLPESIEPFHHVGMVKITVLMPD